MGLRMKPYSFTLQSGALFSDFSHHLISPLQKWISNTKNHKIEYIPFHIVYAMDMITD